MLITKTNYQKDNSLICTKRQHATTLYHDLSKKMEKTLRFKVFQREMAFILRGFLRSKGKADQGKGTEKKNRKAVVPTWKCYKTRSHILVNDVTVHEYKNPLSFMSYATD